MQGVSSDVIVSARRCFPRSPYIKSTLQAFVKSNELEGSLGTLQLKLFFLSPKENIKFLCSVVVHLTWLISGLV